MPEQETVYGSRRAPARSKVVEPGRLPVLPVMPHEETQHVVVRVNGGAGERPPLKDVGLKGGKEPAAADVDRRQLLDFRGFHGRRILVQTGRPAKPARALDRLSRDDPV